VQKNLLTVLSLVGIEGGSPTPINRKRTKMMIVIPDPAASGSDPGIHFQTIKRPKWIPDPLALLTARSGNDDH